VAGCPLRLSDSPVGQLRPAPLLGQSTQEVLADVHDREERVDVVHA
jgi:formyl-CoA transferase